VADVVHELLHEGGPDDPLLTFTGAGTTWTRGELLERAERCADALAASGVGAGDRVAVMLPNRIEYIDLIFGCSFLGAIVVHLHTAAKGQILERALRLAAPRCAVVPVEDLARFEKNMGTLAVLTVDDLAQLVVDAPARSQRRSPPQRRRRPASSRPPASPVRGPRSRTVRGLPRTTWSGQSAPPPPRRRRARGCARCGRRPGAPRASGSD